MVRFNCWCGHRNWLAVTICMLQGPVAKYKFFQQSRSAVPPLVTWHMPSCWVWYPHQHLYVFISHKNDQAEFSEMPYIRNHDLTNLPLSKFSVLSSYWRPNWGVYYEYMKYRYFFTLNINIFRWWWWRKHPLRSTFHNATVLGKKLSLL